jgi:HPt (histidine-containing phosphotransfer) domain-containing protein
MHAIRKQCEMNAETPTIVLTAHAVKGAREEYLSLGYTNYLSKPIDGAKLEAMIQSYLPDEKIVFDFEKKEMHQVQTDLHDNVPNPVLNSISQIEGIDAVKGAETAGGEDAYLLICKNFYETAKMRIGMIRDAYDKEDYDAYTIQVHALKSSARLIGAAGLSEEALELETAGRESNIDLIKKNTGAVVEKYEWYYSKLDEVFGDKASGEEDDRPEIPEEDLKQCLSEMAELLEAFDMDTAKELFDSLADYKMPEGYKDMYDRMKGKMAELDRDGLLDEIQKGR